MPDMKQISIATLLALIAAPALAQSAISTERSTGQAVGLFVQACVPFTGNAAGVRQWAADHQLGLIAPDKAKVFLTGNFTGQVFGASNAEGNYVLISLDNGFCEVVAEVGEKKIAGEFLTAFLKSDGYSVNPTQSQERDGAAQQRFELQKQERRLLISLTQFDGEIPALPPQLRLAVTPAPARP
jgi:hypothetical protein